MRKKKSSWHLFTDSDVGMSDEDIAKSFTANVEYRQAKDQYSVTDEDLFKSLAYAIRDRMLDRWNRTQRNYYETDRRRVYYLSLEFLIGRLARNALLNLDIYDSAKQALAKFELDIEQVLEEEFDAGLGNGGLGRLAACFLDSMATLGLPAMGYGILYEYGIFRQEIANGHQVEVPNNWLRFGSAWRITRPDFLLPVNFYGKVVSKPDGKGGTSFEWVDTQDVTAMANDFLVPGYRNNIVNTLRLWSAKASNAFDFANFNRGDYIKAVHDKTFSENISWVLYPNDNVRAGQELRLKQEYFLVSATLQDALRRHLKSNDTAQAHTLHEKAVFQLNDTHPALAVPELMRLLMDVHGLDWETAWHVTTHAMAYTNHTLLPEALESWPVDLMESVLPRHLQIIYEINRRFLEEVRRRFPGDEGRVARMSLIDETGRRSVRMANLAIVGSYSVNGVSELHSGLVKSRLFPDFYEMYPTRFNNKTNGVTPRRWMAACNPTMSRLITKQIGDGWVCQLDEIVGIAPLADDAGFRKAWRHAKETNKRAFAKWVEETLGVSVDPTSLFDVQVKRIHEYKRQLMNVMYVLSRYLELKKGVGLDRPARTVFIGGKAAPGYDIAKRIIHLVNAAAAMINNDKALDGRLKLLFLPNYSVSVAERVIPAADLSEQISTAGLEASGTGNMKFAMNGALTIGTRDGANIEIGEAVGEENIYFFGLSKEEVDAIRFNYDPRAVFESNPALQEVLHLLVSGSLTPNEPEAFRPIVDTLLGGDPFLVLADFAAYAECQSRVDRDFLDKGKWTRMSIRNTALTSRFSSDNTIAKYADEIWRTGMM
jgi:glycogen phosphorylase